MGKQTAIEALKEALKTLGGASKRLWEQFIAYAWVGFCVTVGALHGLAFSLWLFGGGSTL